MITLDEAKNHVRVDGTADDAAITAMIETAKTHIENYTGTNYAEGEIPAPVKSAALILVADLYDNRTLQVETALYTNRTYAQLLNPYRAITM
jgi:uncharacterized phage protein (predicted DNA packaging)